MSNYFQSQLGKMVPEHKHEYFPVLTSAAGSKLTKRVVEVCKVCGSPKEAK